MRRLVLFGLLLAVASASLEGQRPLAMGARQRAAVRAAAAPYRGQAVELITSGSPRSTTRRFIQAFRGALEAAGLTVTVRAPGDAERGDCTNARGLRVAYSAPLSGAANAIAEALVRSKAVPGSVPGCSIGGDAMLRFVLAE